MAGNSLYFSKEVHHPGTKSDPFLYEALERNRNDVFDTFSKATGLAINVLSNSDWLGAKEKEIRIAI